MTDDELKAYETEADGACSSCMTLVAEVRRLKGLIKEAEWADTGGVTCGPECPWCLTCRDVYDRTHGEQCPAFTPDGAVR